MRISEKFAFAAVSLMAFTAPAFAQAAPDAPKPQAATDDADSAEKEDIVVTGTLIRNTQATGSQTITVDASAIKDISASSTNELLGSIPQITNQFNARPEGDPRGLTAVVSIVRPNLRNFPSTNSTSGALTLIMVDGMRITPVGENASSPDPDIVPAAIMAGVDVVTDGGSSLYGADAVAGVMNFRTMRKFEGVKLDGTYGFGSRIKGFKTWDGSVTAGKSWATGNAYVSVSHAQRDSVLNKQVPWANGNVYNAAGVARVVGTQCNTPQATAVRYNYFNIPGVFTGWTTGGGGGPIALGTGCDTVLDSTYLPSNKRTNVYASLTNSFSDAVDLRITGYWAKRELKVPQYALGYTSKAPAPVTPVGAPGTAGAPASTPFDIPQGVGFALGPNASYVNTPSSIKYDTWGVTPEVSFKLGSNWGLRTSLHYGRSTNTHHFPGLNTAQIDTYVTAGQINPLNIATASSTVIADITNWETAQDTKHEMFIARAIADGSLFALPAGDVKIAVGAEYQFNKDSTRINTGKLGAIDALPFASFSRNVKSIYAELHVPLTSFADIAGSVRHDSYSDVGKTTNPNIGLTIKPASWLKLFGHWGTSYNAPTAYDKLGIGLGRAGVNYVVGAPVGSAQRPRVATGKTDNQQGNYFIVLTGASPAGLKPQTSDSWAIGFEANPIPAINLGAEFYSIDLQNALGTLNPSVTSTYQTNPDLYIYNNELTANGNALFNTIISQLANGAAIAAQTGGAGNVALVVDTRTSNLNAAKVEGVDLHLNVKGETGIGRLSFENNATWNTRARIKGNGAITDERAHGTPRFTWTSSLGWAKNGWSTKLTMNFSGDYHDGATNNLGLEETVNQWAVFNLNLGYDFSESAGPLKGTSIRLKVDNLFDAEPQRVLRANTNNPTFNNWTLGRVIKVGFTTKF